MMAPQKPSFRNHSRRARGRPDYTEEEIITDLEAKAAHWELDAMLNPDTPEIAAVCLDYATHIRTMIELLPMDILEGVEAGASALVSHARLDVRTHAPNGLKSDISQCPK